MLYLWSNGAYRTNGEGPRSPAATHFGHLLERVNPEGSTLFWMEYDTLKEFKGRSYSGMAVGGHHSWAYPDGKWRERKVAPDKWEFTFESVKRRIRSAPVGSGAAPGTQYYWYIVADQKVKKVDQDSYTTLMKGLKYKIAHKRPHWQKWNTYYPGQMGAKGRILSVLEETVAQLKEEIAMEGGPKRDPFESRLWSGTKGEGRMGVSPERDADE